MAMLQDGFLLVTDVKSSITTSPQLDGDAWVEGGEGVRGRMDHFAVLDFTGRPSDAIQAQTVAHAIVALTLSDLVLMRDRLIKLTNKAIAQGVLDVSNYTGTEGVAR